MDLFNRFLGHPTKSADTAKQRLQLVLAHDRSDISPATLDLLKDEIIAVISKHVEIDQDHVEVTVSRVANLHRLVANIPVVRIQPVPPKSSYRRSARRTST
jgi:cell division topological specificity factor